MRGKQRYFPNDLSERKRTPSPDLSPLFKGERGILAFVTHKRESRPYPAAS